VTASTLSLTDAVGQKSRRQLSAGWLCTQSRPKKNVDQIYFSGKEGRLAPRLISKWVEEKEIARVNRLS
jgi:hypothetical protein